MPNPVPLATKEEEERRAWVTSHHEVVRLVKDCFGDRFSNNEIFDRLKISRRTGYRALGNDERIGKAPGRKPKIAEETIKTMIDYIEHGGCNDVGNVWKHLAEKFAPDCNPKTVQDAVKKSGFKNYHNEVKLDPLLNQQLPDNQPAPNEEAEQHAQFALQQAAQTPMPQPPPQEHQSMIDPAFQHAPGAPEDVLRNAIATAPPDHIRMVLQDISSRFAEASQIASAYLCPFASHYSVTSPVAHMGASQMHHALHVPQTHAGPHDQKRRLAICRRCGQQYDRAENTMEKRECLYHKGSPQKISPEEAGAIEQSPEAYIWSCCGGNGMVRGCCRAMHTTKKKRKYSKKRDSTTAGLDDNESDTEVAVTASFMHDQRRLDDPNIDSSLQDQLHPTHMALASLQQSQMQMAPGQQVHLQQQQAQHLQDAARHLQHAALQSDAYSRAQQGGNDSTEDMEAQLQAGLQPGMLDGTGAGAVDHHHGIPPELQLQQMHAAQQAQQQQQQMASMMKRDGDE